MKDQRELTQIVFGKLKNKPKPEDKIFRKCPHCREVWVKVEGCNGTTTCGARVSKKKDADGGDVFKQYRFEFTGFLESAGQTVKKAFKVIKSTAKAVYEDDDLGIGKKKKDETKAKEKAAGCGKSIVWSECPVLNEEELRDLY